MVHIENNLRHYCVANTVI